MVLAHEGAKQQDLSRPATMLEHPEALRTQCSLQDLGHQLAAQLATGTWADLDTF